MLDFGAVGSWSVVGRLEFRMERCIMVKTTKDGLDIAGHQEVALVIGVIPPKGDTAEKGVGPIGG